MNEVDHDRRRIRSGDGWSRSLDVEGPQVWFWVLARTTRQRQTGQEQHLGDWAGRQAGQCVVNRVGV